MLAIPGQTRKHPKRKQVAYWINDSVIKDFKKKCKIINIKESYFFETMMKLFLEGKIKVEWVRGE